MTTTAPAPTPADFADATWDDILPRYEALATRPLDAASADDWLADWSALDEAVGEARSLASIAYTADTTDPAKEAAYLWFKGEIGPRMHEQGVRLANRLIDLGFERADLATTLRRYRNQREIFRPQNVPLQQQEQELGARYQKVTGAMTATWDGEDLPLPRLAPFLRDPDRGVRERAYRLLAAPYVAERDALAGIFDSQFRLRQEIARNAGFANYRDYAFREKNRFDYGPAECEAFHDAIAASVVLAVARRYQRRQQLLGVPTLRPWDTEPDPQGRPALRPFATGDELAATGGAIFARLDPALGADFATMRQERLLDLDSRKGKAPGGYCTSLDHRRRPFIFMNAAGVSADVRTLLHEAGHAFHAFAAYRAQPLTFHREYGAEIAEVASMAMELLAAPYLAKEDGGFYDRADSRRARIEHLEGILVFFPWMAAVDAFQHWLYTSGDGHDRDARDEAWSRIFGRFDAGIDWTGLEAERTARWYRQLHIFLYPFYYVEYGLAQLGALQVWRNSLADPAAALAAYRRALALGGTRPLPELFEAAGARFAFDEATVGELVSMVEEQIAALEAR